MSATVALGTVVELLGRVEALPLDSSGQLVVRTAHAEAVIVIEDSEVCFVHAPDMRARLTELLAEESEGDRDTGDIELVYLHCREEGVPLGPTLLSQGLHTEVGLRQALLRHCAESLVRLGQWDVEGVDWEPSSGPHYQARFSFSPLEVIMHASRAQIAEPEFGVDATMQLTRLAGSGASGAAFVTDASFQPGEGAPAALILVAGVDECDVGLARLMRLGMWAAESLSRVQSFGGEPRLVGLTSVEGPGAVAWVEEDCLFAMYCFDRLVKRRVLARVAKQ